MSKTQGFAPKVEWKHINWQQVERRVFKLQKRIYRASQRVDVRLVHRLQKTLMRSWSAKCLAVRRVTQDNKGKKTAGVDGIKCLTPFQRLELTRNLKLSQKAKPTRRVWIPKPGTNEKRPLGIPTMANRALQALVKLALEPEWEAHFEPNSYGFRPGRSCHDAIEAIFLAICKKSKYVLDADIAKCFDRINHKALLQKLNTFPTIRRQVRAWLQAGVMDGKELFPTNEGTPQGGVISPLLANIALHGMENWIVKAFPKMSHTGRETWYHKKGTDFYPPQVIRYADDLVILHENIEVIQRCQQMISEWLNGMGLELKPSKTRIAHTLNKYEESVGFNFLGFNVRQYPVEKNQSGQDRWGNKLGFKTLIKPSKEAVKKHLKSTGDIIKAHKSDAQASLIGKLNPIIIGWVNYYSTKVSSEIFAKVDHLIYQQLLAWAKRTHTGTPVKEIVSKCWTTVGKDRWVFAAREKIDKNPKGKRNSRKTYRTTDIQGRVIIRLQKHRDKKIVRHVKIKGEASPYDGNLAYWSERMGRHPQCKQEVARLLKQQKGKCLRCGLNFRDEDLLEKDHCIALIDGGEDTTRNKQLLHRHCHDTKTATELKHRQATRLNQELDLDDEPF